MSSSKGKTNTNGAARPFLGPDKKGSNSQVSMMTSYVVCYRCKQTGHKVQDCPFEGNKGKKGRSGKERGCFHCGKHGHIASACPSSAFAFPSLGSVEEKKDTQMKEEKKDTQMKEEKKDTPMMKEEMKTEEKEESGGWTTVTKQKQRKVKPAAAAAAATGSWASMATKAASKPQPQAKAKPQPKAMVKAQKRSSDVDVCQPCCFKDKLVAPKNGGKTQLCLKHALLQFGVGKGCPYEGRCRFAHSRATQDPTKDSAWFNGILCHEAELAKLSLDQNTKWGRINWQWFQTRTGFCPKFIACCNKFDAREPITEDDICKGGINCRNGICGNTPDMDPRDGWFLDEQFVWTGVPSGKGMITPGLVPFDVQNPPKVPEVKAKAKAPEEVSTYQGEDAFLPPAPVDWATKEDNSAWDDPEPKVPVVCQPNVSDSDFDDWEEAEGAVVLPDSWDDEEVPVRPLPVKKTQMPVQFVTPDCWEDEDLDWLEEED